MTSESQPQPESNRQAASVPEAVGGILSARHSVTSAEAYRQIAEHLGRPLSPGRKLTFVNGQKVWACC